MRPSAGRWLTAMLFACAAALLAAAQDPPGGQRTDGQRPVYRSGVDLVHVTVTVTDGRGHFVPGLRREDFRVTDDGEPQTILQFSADRAPVSLGIALDTSSSMAGTKLREARQALYRVIGDLLAPSDEVFIYTFGDAPVLRQAWTTDRQALRSAVDSITADGRTALYDTVGEALRTMETGRYRKRVLLVISDGNDTASFTPLAQLRTLIRESETLVYAIGIDADDRRFFDRRPPLDPAPESSGTNAFLARQVRPPQRPPVFPPTRPPVGTPPDPGTGRPPWAPPPRTPQQPIPRADTANIAALRELTDISGGRTEVVRTGTDIGPATASVADELSRQYQLMYQASTRRDGRWHAIAVTVGDASFQVRARKGYVATKAAE